MAEQADTTARTERRAMTIALAIGVVLLGAKFVAYALTGSAAVFADAMESIVNVVVGAFALWAITYAQQPADKSHPYGHGRVEFVSALLEGGMILVAAVVTAARAAEAAWRGIEPVRLEWGILIVAGAGVINGLVGRFLIRTSRRTGSLTLEADGRHLMTDAVTSAVLVAALVVIAVTDWGWLDPVAAAVLALYLGWEGIHLTRRAFAGLMDKQDVEDDRLLRSILDRHVGASGSEPRICSYHALRHRHVGRDHWVDFHLVVPASWNVERGHETATLIEIELQQGLGGPDPEVPGSARATAHVEPCKDPTCVCCQVGG